MALIKSGDSTDILKVDPVSKAARTTLYSTDGIEFSPGQKDMAASIPVVLASDQSSIISKIVDSDGDTIEVTEKGNQGTFGLSVQEMKDAGRSQVCLVWEEMAGTAAVESALTNFTSGTRGCSVLGAGNFLQVSPGKTLRIQQVSVYVKATGTVTNLARFRIRQAIPILNSSPIIFDVVLPGSSAGAVTAGAGDVICIPIPDGLEVATGQQITFTWFTSANTCTVGMTIIGYEY
jgi:hypothetical protein